MKKKRRFSYDVCKPCWELKYCPYGSLVEQFPLFPYERDLDGVKSNYAEMITSLANGRYKEEEEILEAIEKVLFHLPWKWEWLFEYDTSDLECNQFAHICPVFFQGSIGITETKELRRQGRHIPRDVMLKVVRRDGQVCQVCNRYVPDRELEFDHVIPHSKGGPTTVDNLRVLCRDCNSKKTDSLDDLIDNSLRFLGKPMEDE